MTQISVHCANCNHPNVVDSRLAGSKAICAKCDAMFTIPAATATVAEAVHAPVHTRFKAPVAQPIQAAPEETAIPLHPPIDEDPDFMTDADSELVWADLTKFANTNRLTTAVLVVSIMAFVVQFRNFGFIDGLLWFLLGMAIILNTVRHNFFRAAITPEAETFASWSIAGLTAIIVLRSIWLVIYPPMQAGAVSFAIATLSLVSIVFLAVFILVVAILLFRHGLFKVASWTYLGAAILLPLVLSTASNRLGDPESSFLWRNPPWWASMVGAEVEDDSELIAPPTKKTVAASSQLFDLSKVPAAKFPEPPAPELLEPGVDFRKVRLLVSDGQPGQESTLYVYTPQGSHPPKSLPCVFIAAGSKNYLAGKQLSDEDRAQHLPFARAGFAVVAYEVDGPLANPDSPTDAQAAAAFKEFSAASAGLINARNALAFTLEKMPEINPSRLYTAGHNSAGTLALLFAAHDQTIKAAMGFDPVVNLPQHLQPAATAPSGGSGPRPKRPSSGPKPATTKTVAARPLPPGSKDFVTKASPHTHQSRLQGAVFIYHSGAVSPAQKPLEDFVARLSKTNKNVKLVAEEVDPMAPATVASTSAALAKGTSEGVQWLADLPADGAIMVATAQAPLHQSLGPKPRKWNVQPDAAAADTSENIVEQQPFIPLPPGAGRQSIVTPATFSPFVAVGDNSSPQSGRQVWDLRTSTGLTRLQGEIHFASKPVLSPDGRYLAGAIQNSSFIEVWAFETNDRIRIPFQPDLGSLVLAFLNDAHLLIAGNSNGRAACQIWNFQTGKPREPVPEIEFESGFSFPSQAAQVVSPGGRYLAAFGKGLRVYDLTNGQLAGEVALPDGAKAEVQGLCFSPDGTEVAGIFRDGNDSRLMSWHMADGALIFDSVLTQDVSTSDSGATPIEFFPGNGAWLLFQRAIVERAYGKYVWPLYSGAAVPEAEVIKVLDQDHLLVTSTRMLTAYKLPRDTEGALSLATTRISPETVFKNRSGTGADQTVQANTRTENLDPDRPDIVAVPPDEAEALGRAAREYANQVYVELMTADKAAINSAAGWFRQGRRPAAGVRWGIGLEFTGQAQDPSHLVTSQEMFAQFTGQVGPALLSGLRKRLDNGAFGRWPEFGDPRFRDISWLGAGSRDRLLATATERDLDAVMLFELNSRLVGNNRVHSLQVRLFQGGESQPVWQSKQLSLTYLDFAAARADDLRSELLYTVNSRIDDLYVLKEIPALKPEHMTSRVQALMKDKIVRPLPYLFEVLYYHVNGRINNQQAAALYDRVIPGKGKELAEGTENERRQILRQFLARS